MSEKGTGKKFSKGKKLKFILFTLVFLMVVILIISEILLGFMHYMSSYDKMQLFSIEKANWWTSDSINGPRYVSNGVNESDSIFLKNETWYYNRLKIVNNAGYHDKDNFTEIPSTNDSLRILFAGDSFTWGASADVDSSYVDVFENDIRKAQPALVWNTGIPATGTNHALFTVKKFLPLQKSNYVVLGFYVSNDFEDNLLPFDQLVFNRQASCYNLYNYDNEFKAHPITTSEAYRNVTGSMPMNELNFIQKIFIRSRFIAFVSDMMTKIKNKLNGSKKRQTAEAYKRTTMYLKALNDYVKENNARLIVLVIPDTEDMKEKGARYQQVIKTLKELSINHLEVVDLFTNKDYVEPDGHWNNSGHIKTGHKLGNFLLEDSRK